MVAKIVFKLIFLFFVEEVKINLRNIAKRRMLNGVERIVMEYLKLWIQKKYFLFEKSDKVLKNVLFIWQKKNLHFSRKKKKRKSINYLKKKKKKNSEKVEYSKANASTLTSLF